MKLLKLFIFPIGVILFFIFIFLDKKPRESQKYSLTIDEINTGNKPEIKIENFINDFGYVKINSTIAAIFPIINEGKVPLIISAVNSSCNCIIDKWNKQPILPGDTTIIKIQYNSSIPGHFVKRIFVSSNAENSPVMLVIRGQIVL